MDVRSPFFQNVATVLVGVMFLNPIVGAAAELTVAAGSGATVGQARNGVPVVNIAAPNGNGLSHNKFKDYNVGQQGLILNNATSSTQSTQLGGIILGNSNLNGRAAGLILNEVTGANASRLQGYTEVAGKSAHVIVANPHGISCDGCGFINTPRVTLSTGTPIVENGRLDRFDVNGGSIAIEGRGLNASNVDQFDLITRSAKINAELHANRLNIITGRNEVKADDLSVTAKAPDGSDQPLLAIDSSALGGMYAGAIRLVGTEAGVGVKLAGDMAASAGDIRIDANGQLSVGRAAATRDISLKAQAVELEQATYAGRDANIEAETLSNQVSLATGGDLTITARHIDNAQNAVLEAGIRADGGTNAAATLTVTGEDLDNAGDIVAHGALNTGLKALNNHGTVVVAGEASVTASTLDNQSGTLIGQQALKITGDQLNNRAGTVASNGALDVTLSGDLDNRDDGILLSKGGDLNVAAQTLNNQNGNVQADNGVLVITAVTLNNIAGNIGAAQGALNLDAATIHNQGGNLQGSTVTLTGQTLNNGGSVIASTGQAQLTVDTLNNANGTLLAATDLSIIAIDLSNDSGKVGANAVDLNLSGKLDNNNGLIESATTLGVTAEQASNIKGKLRALGSSGHSQFSLGRLFDNTSGLVEIGNAAFTLGVPSLKNQGGTVRHLGTAGLNIGMDNLGSAGGSFMTNSALVFNADEWTNTSQIQAGRLDLDIKRLIQANTGALLAIDSLNLAGHRWINDGRIETDGDLVLTLAGDYSGNGALLAQNDLTLNAANISVGQNGELRSGGVGTFTAAQAFNNAGVVTSTTGLELNAASVLNQGTLGSSENLRIVTPSLSNVGGLIFSGANMDLFANQLTNRKADIYSLGNLLVAANSDGDKASRFSNLSGTVESAGWMSVAASVLENARETLDISSSKYAARLYYVGCTDCSGTNEDGLFKLEEIDRTTATNVSPQAQLLAGGDMSLASENLSNRYSLIASGGDLRIDTEQFNNQGAQTGTVLTSRQLKTHRVRAYAVEYQKEDANNFTNLHWHTSPNFTSANIERDLNAFFNKHVEYTRETYEPVLSDVQYYHATVQAAGDVKINASQRFNNSVINPSFAYVAGGTRNPDTTTPGSSVSTQVTFKPQLPPDLNQQVVDPLTLPGFSLPQGQNGMFHFNPSGSHNYLIETNPAFASLKNFLSSDYMLGQLGYDTDVTQKRLGDGFYEQRLIREAIVDRTGQRYLAGLTSDEAMFRYLMDNAIASKDALGLSLGVSLTAEQVAALTHDIVWMEEREVMGEKVLVPMLYLAQAEGRLAPTGALIQGQDVALIGGASLNNQGTLRASQNLDITAGNITNSGLMQANERLQLLATDSIRNAAGGIIAGRDVTALALTGDIINERSITTHEATLGSRYQDRQDFADNAARIEAGNDLQLSAGRDLLNVGGALSAGGDASLSAGRDLVIASQQEEDAYARKDRKSRTNQQVITQHASEVNIGGDLVMQADRDLTVIGSRVEAGGDMALRAGENLTIASAANESHYEHHRKSGGKKVDIVRDSVKQQSAELVAGGNFTAISGADTTIVSSTISAGNEAYLYAGGDLNLLAAQNSDYSLYDMKSKGSWGSKKTQRDEVTTVRNIGSTLTTGGDLTLASEGDQRYQNARLESGNDLTLDSGGAITFEAVKDLDQESHEKSKSGALWQSAKGKGTTDETVQQSVLIAKGETVIRAVEGLQIDIKHVDQQTVSQTIDAMVQADPELAWLKEMEQRGDVDWRRVKEVHDSFKYSHSGLGGAAMIVIAIIVTYLTAGAASGLVASAGTSAAGAASAAGASAATAATVGSAASAATNAVLASAASGAVISTINNRGDLGAVLKDVTSSESLKGYAVGGITAGLTAGLYDGWTGTETASSSLPSNSGLLANSGAVGGASNIGQFAANQILQNGTSAMVSQALGLEADLRDALQNALANTFAAAGFNLVGDLSAPGNWDLQGGSPAKIGLHALMGGLAAEAAGGDFRTGALAAGVNEALVDSLALQYAGMDPDKKKGLLVMNSQVIGVLAAAAQGNDDTESLQTGAWVAGNATKYNHFALPAGLMQYGQSAGSLGEHMQEQGASPQEISAALRDHARSLGFEGPEPGTELLKAGGLFVPAGLGVVISAPVTLGSVAVGAIASGGVEYFYQYNIDTGSVVLTDVGKASLIGALSQGKNLPVTVMVNVGGEYAYKKVKNEEIGASLVGATLGSAAGWKASSKIYDGLGKGVPDSVRTSLSSLLGSYASKNISAVTEDLAEGK
ncbi:two-partner secretion domain-containing protein [Stutzerimonas nitrititolerans]|uniref:two-partner secretion domain-containing protein n=1 Tax=Stutzerimonas nitrititolerans TaxID=2482751 RepID=UPI0028AF69F6|nr:DUF637 domain-containing protein [Stutzerimonas nitrititolerans]